MIIIEYDNLSIKWNLIRLGGLVNGIVTKAVHTTLPGGDKDKGVGDLGVGGLGLKWDRGLQVVGVKRV